MKRQTEKEPAGEKISRREFFKDAGLIVGGAAIGTALPIATASAESVARDAPSVAAPAQATPFSLEVLDPSPAYKVSFLHAPRLDTLEGKTICEVSSEIWQAWRTFPLMRELLQKKYPTAKFVKWEEFAEPGVYDGKNLELLKEKGCDAVIVGNAG